MGKSTFRRTGVCISAVALLGGAVACTSDGDGKSSGAAKTPVQALQAAFKKTSAAKSAKVHMTVSAPEGAGTAAGTEVTMDGVVGWNPGVMDMTMSGAGAAAAGAAGGDGKTRMIMIDNVMYTQLPAGSMKDAPEAMRGKKWMKLDAKSAPNAALQKSMGSKMDSANQDPSKQMATLLDSPNLKRVGEEKVNGTSAQHYKGTLTVDDMAKGTASAEVMDAKEREALLETVKQAGIKSYDTDIWVNGDNLPVKMTVVMDSAQGKMKMSADYTDYGTKVDVKAPAAGEVADFGDMIKDLSKAVEDAKRS
ncbi:hypothetical protein ACFP1Z_17030 [Streptomyces gamaensis]|uniref:Lipoprotein n=1 Tax=Streptomyces gamaensis TaxID=1763542 RepID=A0ABW0Z4A3_9ACTN